MTWTGCHNRFISSEEQRLYDHLLECVDVESPEQLLDRFRTLFIDGTGYPDREVGLALDKLLSSDYIEQYFRYVLNRCCHILINRWQARPQLQAAIPTLIDLFDAGSSKRIKEFSRIRSARRLRGMVAQFLETEQYVTLRRLARVVSERPEGNGHAGSHPLGTLIGRYPYLYEHCLLSEDSTQEHQQNVRRIKGEAQQRFEIDLSQYVNYRVRRARMNRQGASDSAARILRPLENPTLLSDRELVSSLRQFSGKVEHNRSYRELAQCFTTRSCHPALSFKAFKHDLYEYLTAGIDTDYGRRQFNNLLYAHLADTYPESESKQLNDFLVVRTCSQLFSFLVVDSSSNPEHFVFVDLINNLGPLCTAGILLKIVLLCRKIKPYLERRLSILFNHYESDARDTVAWLVNMLENLNVALSINFGSVDLSHII